MIPLRLLTALAILSAVASGTEPTLPHLRKQGTATQLIVDGWLNGDQTHQGRHLRLEPGRFTLQRIKLYRYR